MHIQPAILSGGAGTRLWPLSREARPKQFLKLGGERTLFQETLLRVAPAADAAFLPPIVVGGARHLDLIRGQAAEVGVELAAIIAEPLARSTAPAAAVAALWTERAHKDALVLLVPSDHRIRDAAAFRAVVRAGAGAAQSGRIVTLGVKPSGGETGYGYIERGERLAAGVFAVAAFREKPDAATAAGFAADGRHFWNAGVFLYAPATLRSELERHAPQIAAAARAAYAKANDADGLLHLDADEFGSCPSLSFDYAVMERTDRAAVAGPLDADWSDVGAYSALSPAKQENVVAVDAENCTVLSEGPLVALVGVKGLAVAATKDAVLVCAGERAQDVRAVVEELKRRGRTDLL